MCSASEGRPGVVPHTSAKSWRGTVSRSVAGWSGAPASAGQLASVRMVTGQCHGAVRWDVVRFITPGILVGTFGATFIASHVASRPLAIFFACFMAYVSTQMLLNIKPKPSRALPGPVGMSGVGLGIGGISALVAIGGGSLSVPFMTWCNVKMQNAIGTSAAIGLPIALAGTAGYVVNGLGAEVTPAYTAGFIYLPALVLITAVSMFTAPVGARLAHRLPVAMLKKIFAGVLIVLSLKMLHSVFGA